MKSCSTLCPSFPHYFIGSNADLPIVGGSILSHDHFQGGRYVFPMTEAPIEIPLHSPDDEVSAGILDWPMSTLRLTGRNPQRMIDVAEKVLTAWRQWNDESLNILSYTDAPHNTITPILRRKGENYVFDLVLRNNHHGGTPDGHFSTRMRICTNQDGKTSA